MVEIGCNEARLRLSELLERVAQGESCVITRYGKPVAVLVPIEPEKPKDAIEAIQAMKEFGKGRRLNGLSIKEMIAEGRRF